MKETLKEFALFGNFNGFDYTKAIYNILMLQVF